jgi:hypothetical protein
MIRPVRPSPASAANRPTSAKCRSWAHYSASSIYRKGRCILQQRPLHAHPRGLSLLSSSLRAPTTTPTSPPPSASPPPLPTPPPSAVQRRRAPAVTGCGGDRCGDRRRAEPEEAQMEEELHDLFFPRRRWRPASCPTASSELQRALLQPDSRLA